MFGNSITIGRLFGIRLAVSLSWFVIFFLILFSLGGVYFPNQYPRWPSALHWGMAVAASLLFFLCVVLHELAHSLVAVARDVPVRGITLFLFGGVSHMARDAPSPVVEFLIALAGPAVSLAIGLLTGGLFLLVRQTNEPAGAVLLWLAGVNLSLALFNLLPGFPLDGGRLVRAAVWFAADDFRWATRVATRAGQLAAMTLIAAGTFLAFFERPASLANGIWLMLIGWFLLSAASGSYQATLLLHTLQGVLTRDVARRDPLLVDASITLSELAQLLLEHPDRAPAVVLRDGAPIGIVDHTALRRVRSGQYAETRVVDTMRALDDELLLAEDLPASQALQLLLENGLEWLPVVASGEVVGVIRRDDLIRLTEVRRLSR